MPGGAPLANAPIREASQLAAQMAGTPMPGGMPMPGMPNPQIGTGGVSMAGQKVLNAPPNEEGIRPEPDEIPDGQATPDSAQDTEPGDRPFIEEPWFARLPPELRKAIRNNSQRRAPRGYEQRLKRYFESMD